MTRGKAGLGATVAGVLVALAVTGAGAATAGQRAHASASTVGLKADPSGQLKFNKRRLTAPAGRITIVMTDPSSSMIQHGIAVAVKGPDKKGKIVNPGNKSRLTVTLKAGTYTFYCPVPGHRAAGMKGRLVVN
jgi:plastocyanin